MNQINNGGDNEKILKIMSASESTKTSLKPSSFIPPVPGDYCFVDENFLSESFSVDGFVRRNSKRVTSLEKLRENLNVYLKILKQSMIKSINEDYTEFINLSANLVSFEKSITHIKIPISKFKNETYDTKMKIDEVIISMQAKKERLKAIRESKQKLNMILEIIDYLDRIEANIEDINSKRFNDPDDQIEGRKFQIYSSMSESSTLIARLNLNFEFLFSSTTSQNQKNNTNPFIQKYKQRFDIVSENFYKILGNEVLFLFNYDSGKDAIISDEIIRLMEQLFSMYLIDGNKKELIILIRKNVVKPSLDEIMGGVYMSNNNRLEIIFSQVINFIEEKFGLFIKVLNVSKVLAPFQFELIVSTIWDTFIGLFLIQTPLHLLSDAETFQKTYFSTFKFIDEFLKKTFLSDHRVKFEKQESFVQLKSKFKLNVYFHMKLQKISTNLEDSLAAFSYRMNDLQSPNTLFRLRVTSCIHETMIDCWHDATGNFYVGDIFIYLWKLTLKILSRFACWLVNIDLNDINSYLKSENNNLDETNLKRLLNQILSASITDSFAIIEEFKKLFETVILPIWDSYFSSKLSRISDKDHCIDHLSIKNSFQEAIENFESNAIRKTISAMKREIIDDCKRFLSNVNDIPRLYRRTNKEKPREASSYIGKCIDYLVMSIGMIGFGQDRNNTYNQFISDILVEIAQYYKDSTLEVLTSVQKTEDSLKKLKKLKVSPGALSSPNPSMSDDNKIRLQIYYDVKQFGDEIKNKLAIESKLVKPYLELSETIDSLKVLL